MSLRVALIGTGRMAREIEAIAAIHDAEIVATLGRRAMEGGDGAGARSDGASVADTLRDADVAIEFTTPGSAVANVEACVAAGCPVVVGTTGWYDRLPEVEALVDRGGASVLWAANFSTGIAVLRSIAGRAAGLLRGLDEYDFHIVETHHAAKRDAPSGTALVLRDALAKPHERSAGITSIRVGLVPGTHEIVIDGPFEQIVLKHEARDRRVFADGALRAARWLHGREGLFTYEDVFG